MSGGVDSAVAAARAADAGHDVTGVHLALSRNPQTYRAGARGCCTLEDARDARRAADVIGIPFYVWDMAEQFHEDVVDDFVAEYAAGRTPNPCLRCNEKIKFAAVLDRAIALGFDAVVTGHHARLGDDGLLRRSVDLEKDQSYVLAVLTRAQLDKSMFPLGSSTKTEVRAEAAERDLAVAEKPDSHDICFIADGDTQGFLTKRLGTQSGDIVDAATGAVLGQHDGAYGFTVGQRKGLNLGRPAPDGRPRYVLSITPVTNTVVVGPAEALDVSCVHAERPVWTGLQSSADFPVRADVQMRAHGQPVAASLALDGDGDGDGDGVVATLDSAVRGIAAGQALVAYQPDAAGDIVLGSATITHTSATAVVAG
jgi:tRNA-uridine 2-sulfurtransferase